MGKPDVSIALPTEVKEEEPEEAKEMPLDEMVLDEPVSEPKAVEELKKEPEPTTTTPIMEMKTTVSIDEGTEPTEDQVTIVTQASLPEEVISIKPLKSAEVEPPEDKKKRKKKRK